MPQVLSAPGPDPGVIVNAGTDLFSFPAVQLQPVLGMQVPLTQPLPPGTVTATNLLVPDAQVISQLRNFPPAVYDLAPTSLLVHFMTALLGNSGCGQLRKRQMIARLQQAITSTRFYDLDSFYGALFGAQRGPSGTLPVNPSTGVAVSPYTDLASPDAWDEVEAIDARFRERVIALARAITLGGTVQGLQALAEAITGVTCQVYEMWRLLDNAEGPAPGYQTWEEVTASFPAWSAFPSTATWQSVEGIVSYAGLLGGGIPGEVVIIPEKSYSSSVAGLAQQGADYFGILSVVEVLRPAAALVSVNVNGPGVVTPAVISSAWADSQYWGMVHVVTPGNPASPAYSGASSSYQGVNSGQFPPGSYVTPSPPLSRSGGGQYSYAGDVTTVTAAAVTGTGPNSAQVTDGQDYQVVVFPVGSPPAQRGVARTPLTSLAGTVSYLPAEAILPPAQAQSAMAASAAAVVSAPYSGPRVPVMRAS